MHMCFSLFILQGFYKGGKFVFSFKVNYIVEC